MAMKFDIFYRRPSGVLVRDDPANDSDDSSSSRPSSITTGIPAQLSFDKIIAGETREVRITTWQVDQPTDLQIIAMWLARLYEILPLCRTFSGKPAILLMAPGLYSAIL